jgi:Flp pilus assembly protein TadG
MRLLELFDRFARDRQGVVGVLTAIMLMTLLTAAGVAIDLARAVQFRTALQNALDSAALAGASVYSDTTKSAAATAVANSYMNSIIGSLPQNSGVSFTVTPATTANGFTVTVSASAPVPTTIMALVASQVPVAATATAINPVVIVNFDLGGAGSWYSNAADTNTVYWYIVPSDGSVPTPAQIPSDHQLFTNATGAPAPSGVQQVPAQSNQNIGFAFKNVTGGNSGYGPNAYGAAQGTTHWFFSQTKNLSQAAYPGAPGPNCSVQTVAVNNKTYSNSPPIEGNCIPSTVKQSPAPSCSDLNDPNVLKQGQAMRFYWNDMGGAGSDDKDYNDGEYNVSCTAPQQTSTPRGVVLIR